METKNNRGPNQNCGVKVDSIHTLVLLHGFMGLPSDWDDYVSAWEESEPFAPAKMNPPKIHTPKIHRVLLPGHGCLGKDNISPLPDPLNLTTMAQVVLEQIYRSLGREPFHLIGYSLGGRIALNIALQSCTRLRTQLKSLTLISANPGIDASDRRKARNQG